MWTGAPQCRSKWLAHLHHSLMFLRPAFLLKCQHPGPLPPLRTLLTLLAASPSPVIFFFSKPTPTTITAIRTRSVRTSSYYSLHHLHFRCYFFHAFFRGERDALHRMAYQGCFFCTRHKHVRHSHWSRLKCIEDAHLIIKCKKPTVECTSHSSNIEALKQYAIRRLFQKLI